MLTDRFRNWIACYAAAITIILQQLNTQASADPTETPNPLVRIQPASGDDPVWHQNELVSNRSGRKSVLVWESEVDRPTESMPARILSN